jgi:GAF domain-containing protein
MSPRALLACLPAAEILGRPSMPYLRCSACGVTGYASRGIDGVISCPDCGLPSVQRNEEATRRVDSDRRLDALVRLTRDLLDTDLAILSEIRDGREIARRVSGDWAPLSLLEGASLPLEDTFCRLLLEGRIGNCVPDVAADDRVRDLSVARQLGVGAWLGIAIEPSDTQVYVLCCLAREARPSLGESEVRLLRGLAESVLAELKADHTD